MTQFYSNPSRENDPCALPDAEVFYADLGELDRCFYLDEEMNGFGSTYYEPTEAGWYYWFCFPGCLPDSDPFGPFESEQAAIDAAREDYSVSDSW